MRVLLVEDDFLLATDLAATIDNAGHEVVGPAGTVDTALRLIERHEPDLAVLDVNLRGSSSAPVAEALNERAIPFLVYSGYAETTSNGALSSAPLLTKPCTGEELISAIEGLFDRSLLSERR